MPEVTLVTYNLRLSGQPLRLGVQNHGHESQHLQPVSITCLPQSPIERGEQLSLGSYSI